MKIKCVGINRPSKKGCDLSLTTLHKLQAIHTAQHSTEHQTQHHRKICSKLIRYGNLFGIVRDPCSARFDLYCTYIIFVSGFDFILRRNRNDINAKINCHTGRKMENRKAYGHMCHLIANSFNQSQKNYYFIPKFGSKVIVIDIFRIKFESGDDGEQNNFINGTF